MAAAQPAISSVVSALVLLVERAARKAAFWVAVVYGQDKLDEISASAPTTVCEFRDGWFRTYTIAPEDFGLTRCKKEDLVGGTPEENAAITRAILQGEKGPKRTAVLLNAGAALYIGGKADTMQDGIRLAAEMIDSGRALETLEKVIAISNLPEE